MTSNREVTHGTLLFTGWPHKPWRLSRPNGSMVDLFPPIHEKLLGFAGKRVSHDREKDNYSVRLDPSSDFELFYEEGTNPVIAAENGSFSNLGVYLESSLMWLTGRQVIFAIDDEGFDIRADPSEDVPLVKFFGTGNSCRVLKENAKPICKIGEPDCCIFLTAGGNGFSCEKFNDPLARMLLTRHVEGTMRASRLGNCGINGREE